MKLIVDVMGGDKAPEVIVEGAAKAAEELGVNIIFVGDEKRIGAYLDGYLSADRSLFEIVHSDKVITMHDDPTSVIKANKDSSMGVAMSMLRDGAGDAVISAGNSGAMLCGASLIVKRLPGVKRPAFATVIPFGGRKLLIDSGSNSEVKPEYYRQFAIMGSIYMREICGVASPRVGILCNGTEETKGTPVSREGYALIKDTDLNFIGNIEGRDLFTDLCDVVVSDGFSGNIALKTIEGSGKYFSGEIKKMFGGASGALAYLLVKKRVKALKNSLDYRIYGGAPILGVEKTVVKAHGNSDATAMYYTVLQASKLVGGRVTEKISEKIAEIEGGAENE